MRSIAVLFIIILALPLSGCSDIGEDFEAEVMGDIPIIGWFWRDHAPAPKPVANTTKVTAPGYSASLPPLPPPPECPEHQFWNQLQHACACEADYYMQDGGCVPKASRECVVDRDCSPDGRLSACSGTYAKRVYYCDLTDYHCAGGKGHGMLVDCRTEYGPKYTCKNGNCVE